MKPHNDVPLICKDDDKLHRSKFCDEIVDTIIKLPKGSESIVIGLIGGWGTGKSTIVNFCEIDLKENNINVIRFNPWNYFSQNYLYSAFFNELISSMGLGFKTKYKLKKYNEKIIKTGLDLVSIWIPFANSFSNFITESENNTLNNLKKSLDNDLKKKEKIVVIIDDIDRLNPYEVEQIFQLVKSLANFPNIIYILAFDDEYVNHALKDWNPNNNNYSYSEDFIDKIVQIPIRLPKFHENDLRKIFLSNFELILENHNEINVSNFNMDKLFNLLKPFFSNIRHINRYCNILDFYLYSISPDIDIFDFSLITSLQMFESRVYEKIKVNAQILTGTISTFSDSLRQSDEKELELFLNDVDSLINCDKSAIHDILKQMFPKIRDLHSKFVRSDEDCDSEYSRGCIMFLKFFDFYFVYDVIGDVLTKSKIVNIIDSANNFDDLKSEFFRIIESHYFISVLYDLKRHGDRFDDLKIINLMKLVTRDYNNLIKTDDFINSNQFVAVSEYLFDIINKSNIDKNRIISLIDESELNEFLVHFIWYGDRFNQFNDEQKVHLNKTCSDYLKNQFETNSVAEINNCEMVLGFWKDLSMDDSFKDYIDKLSDEHLLYLVFKDFLNDSDVYIDEIIFKKSLDEIYGLNYLKNRFKKMDLNNLKIKRYSELIKKFLKYVG